MLASQDSLHAAVIEADLDDDREALADACGRVRASRCPQAWAGFMEPFTAIEGTAWVFDDDAALGETDPDPVLEALVESLGHTTVDRVHALAFRDLEPMRERLRWFRLFDRLTHVVSAGARLSGPVPPGLRCVCGAATNLSRWLRAGPDHVQAVTFARELDLSVLDRLAGLRHLGAWHLDPYDVVALLEHPVVQRLDVLDLFHVHGVRSFPFAEVIARRDALVHLRRLCLPGHGVLPKTRAAFGSWPQVLFASHDRLELTGQDLRAVGFPHRM